MIGSVVTCTDRSQRCIAIEGALTYNGPYEDRAPLVDGREARDAVEVILAAYASAALGRPVRVDEVRDLPEYTCS